MTNDLKIIENNRDALLLAQAGALLHNLGKVTSQFFDNKLNGDKGAAPKFKYQHILRFIEMDYQQLQKNIPNLHTALQQKENKNVLDSKTVDSLKRCFELPSPFDDRSYRPGDMIEYLGQGKQDNKLYSKPPQWITDIFNNGSRLTHLMNRSHRGASGGEKQDICAKGQTKINEIYKSTPFGWESRAFNLNDVDNHKRDIEKIIQTYLEPKIVSLNFEKFCNDIYPHLNEVIADTQRPINDVTIWDIGHSGMAFMLTQTIGLMMTQCRTIDHDELAKVECDNTLFWRVMGIRIDGLNYMENAPSLADMRVRYDLLNKRLEYITQTLEEMPVAIKVYTDENGSFYIFPDLPITNSLVQTILDRLQSQLTVDGVALKCSLSEPLVNHPDDKGCYIGEYISRQIDIEKPIVYDPKSFTDPWTNKESYEICVACGVRPQGYGANLLKDYLDNPKFYSDKAKSRDICCICMDKRRDVAKKWATQGLKDTTVWIDEVADNNGRIALIAGQFDFREWKMWYPGKNTSIKMVESQSFARQRRVWETTRQFWEEAGDFSKLRKTQRLQITGKLNPKASGETPGHYHVYQLLLGNVKLSAVWDNKNSRFIIASNLEHISKSQRLGIDIKDWLNAGQEIKIEEPTGYGSKNKDWGSITIDKPEPIPGSSYIPAIPILAEPRTFMALVPADKSLDIMDDIKNKYELEMGKVRNRLPIHLGMVFADYKTPLRVILDAGRRMLKQESCHVDKWHVTKKEGPSSDISLLPNHLKNNKHFAEFVRLELSRDGRRAVWHVPLKMGDGNTEDEWYPYVFVQYDKEGKTPAGRTHMFETPCPWNKDIQGIAQSTWLVHASDIQDGDVVYFTSATLDFQWLDTSGRRFEIAYDDRGCRLDVQRRPYMLDEIETIKKIWKTLCCHLTSTQIHGMNELIETKRSEWESSKVFRQFCRNTIANLDWKKKNDEYAWEIDKKPEEEWLNEWTDYAECGLLNDIIELYMKILKKNPENECEEIS